MENRVTLVSAKDCQVSYFVGRGKGGQNKQKNHTGVLIIHPQSGATGRSSETRSRVQNQKSAFLKLVASPKMKVWLNAKIYELQQGETLDAAVDRQMAPENLKIEVCRNGKGEPE